jgi:hypothetical protein
LNVAEPDPQSRIILSNRSRFAEQFRRQLLYAICYTALTELYFDAILTAERNNDAVPVPVIAPTLILYLAYTVKMLLHVIFLSVHKHALYSSIN